MAKNKAVALCQARAVTQMPWHSYNQWQKHSYTIESFDITIISWFSSCIWYERHTVRGLLICIIQLTSWITSKIPCLRQSDEQDGEFEFHNGIGWILLLKTAVIKIAVNLSDIRYNFVRNSPGVRHRQSASHPRRPPRPTATPCLRYWSKVKILKWSTTNFQKVAICIGISAMLSERFVKLAMCMWCNQHGEADHLGRLLVFVSVGPP